ncbi:MAG: DNA polymerase III subunit alpha [Saprospiraceae bacterium]|nr:DNA polymerase III subunit alpha [Saprospiraceae bacterium]
MYLNCHTYFSLRYGVLGVRKLVQLASDLRQSCLALTDINNTSCAIEFVNCCKEYGINPVLGIEFRDKQDFRYIGLAHDRSGFAQLNLLLNRYLVEGQALPPRAPVLPGVSFVYDYRQILGSRLDLHEYAGVRPNQINHWYRWQHHFPADRTVAWMPVTLDTKRDWSTHQLLRCIALGTIHSKLSKDQCCQPDEYMLSVSEVNNIYRAYPLLVSNGRRLLTQCTFEQADALPNKQHYLDNSDHDQELLTHLSLEGLRQRYPVLEPLHSARLEEELEMIFQLRFEAYFLITWDIVQYARKAGYRHVGRGSGANSLVAYCLQITDVDPIALNLYFERFINPHRPVPPDFDLDFSWDERDDVIQYIQQRYGHDRVGLLGSYQTFKGKSVVREVGKVFGLSRKDIDWIVSQPRASSRHHPLAETIFREGKCLLGLPSHLSIHSGGIVIAESGLHNLTSSQMMPKGFAIIQIDMHHAADWGLHKFDILSQRGTGHIKEAVELVEQHHGTRIDISNMPMITTDKATFQLLTSPGGCIGCFYIESPAMRGLLAKVPCSSYQDLVAVSSIIRPGVSKSGMMQKYIERFHDSSKITHIHPKLAELLEDTFGIMVYQEDVMKVVRHFAGFSLYEADLLRRLMTGKHKTSESLQHLKDRFFTNCAKSGQSERVVTELWRQIESFSGYAFCKAHSATYAAESLQSLFLKAHYPIEFMVAVINNEGGFYPMGVYIRELIRLGGIVEAPASHEAHGTQELCKAKCTWVSK